MERNGLMDFLQSASNSVAGKVAGPVDFLSWGMREAGIPIPNDPVGGSAWMRRNGLVRDVEQNPYSMAGDAMGYIPSPDAVSKVPQVTNLLGRILRLQ